MIWVTGTISFSLLGCGFHASSSEGSMLRTFMSG